MTVTAEVNPPANRAPFVVRAAVGVGHALGSWRRNRLAEKQDEYVKAWKAAWTEGCEARWQNLDAGTVPHQSGPRHDAWVAGWTWADSRPDLLDPDAVRPLGTMGTGNGTARQAPASVSWAVKGGVVGLGLVTLVRWMRRSKPADRPSQPTGARRPTD